MKIYLHKRLLFPILAMLALCIFCWYLMQDEHYSFKSIFCFCCVVVLAVVFCIMLWKYRTHQNWEIALVNSRKVVVEVRDDAILFPNGYYFRQSPVYKSRQINAADINEIWTGTYPISVITGNREVIFLDEEVRESILLLGSKRGIPISDRTDVWAWIAETNIGKEYTEETAKAYEMLAANGIERDEVKVIKRRFLLGYLMDVDTGMFDYLRNVMEETTYWWAMEIALRNYTSKK